MEARSASELGFSTRATIVRGVSPVRLEIADLLIVDCATLAGPPGLRRIVLGAPKYSSEIVTQLVERQADGTVLEALEYCCRIWKIHPSTLLATMMAIAGR
jgi:hypothetical protein